MSEPAAPERLPLTSADPLRGRLEELRALAPDAFVEGKLSPTKLAQLLGEIIFKSGLPLTAKVEKLDAAGKPAWRVADGALVVCLDRAISQNALRAIIALKPQRVVCLDLGFAGNDALKTNTVLEMKSHGVEFQTA